MPPGTVALADDPDHQCRHEIGWDPSSGHVLLCGGRGSGTTTALAALALDVARRWSPDEAHLLVADLGGGTLAPLADLPHTGAVVTAGDRERLERFVRVLRRELDRRRDSGPGCPRPPRLIALIDGLPALRAELEESRRFDLLDELDRVLAEGPEVGLAAAITADRLAAIPAALAATVAQKWLFRPADPAELSLFGLRAADAPSWCPGRVHLADRGLEAQVADPGPLADAVARLSTRWPSPRRVAPGVGSLPDHVGIDDLLVVAPDGDVVLVGVGDADLRPIGLAVRPGDHVLVAGPARSGRTNALAVLARQVRRAHPDAWLGAVLPRPSSAFDDLPFDVVGSRLDQLDVPADRHAFLFVDDAELVDDPGGALAARARAVSIPSSM